MIRRTTRIAIQACRPVPSPHPAARRIDAALHPADVPYLYFVSRNDGTHVFATTLAEHNRNVAQWQQRYWRRGETGDTAPSSATPRSH